MRGHWAGLLLASLVLGQTVQSVAGQSEAASPPPVVPADQELVEQVLVESEVDRDPERADWTEYFGHLIERIRRFILLPIAAGAESVVKGIGILAWMLISGAVLALVLWLVTWLVGQWRKTRGDEETRDVELKDGESRSRSAAEWRRELDRRLGEGLVSEALEATWWWLARSVAGHRVHESWTSRELVAQVGRRDLSPLLATLDTMAFGVPAPEIMEVQAFVRRLDGVLS